MSSYRPLFIFCAVVLGCVLVSAVDNMPDLSKLGIDPSQLSGMTKGIEYEERVKKVSDDQKKALREIDFPWAMGDIAFGVCQELTHRKEPAMCDEMQYLVEDELEKQENTTLRMIVQMDMAPVFILPEITKGEFKFFAELMMRDTVKIYWNEKRKPHVTHHSEKVRQYIRSRLQSLIADVLLKVKVPSYTGGAGGFGRGWLLDEERKKDRMREEIEKKKRLGEPTADLEKELRKLEGAPDPEEEKPKPGPGSNVPPSAGNQGMSEMSIGDLPPDVQQQVQAEIKKHKEEKEKKKEEL